MNVIVIGSSLAGLACSIRLALEGHKVTICEATAEAGGSFRFVHKDGFHFCRDAPLLHAPEELCALFSLAGKRLDDYLRYTEISVRCRYFYPDKTTLSLPASRKAFEQEISQRFELEDSPMTTYLTQRSRLFERVRSPFLERSLHRWSTYFSKKTWALLPYIFQMPLLASFHRTNKLQLEHPKLVQLIDDFSHVMGSSPYRMPGVLPVLPHLEYTAGSFVVKGGKRALLGALLKLSAELGVEHHFETPVRRILLKDRQAAGVSIPHGDLSADAVVSGVDAATVYHHMLPRIDRSSSILKQERSYATLHFFWGIEGTFEEMALQNVFFGPHYVDEFKELFEAKQMPKEPTFRVHITAKNQHSDAPSQQENWVVSVPAPTHTGQDWSSVVESVRSYVLDRLRRVLGRSVESLIRCEHVHTPADAEQYGYAYQGSCCGTSHHGILAAFARHPNFSKSISRLYFCGSSVHPGAGLPRNLMSAKIVSDLMSADFKKKRL